MNFNKKVMIRVEVFESIHIMFRFFFFFVLYVQAYYLYGTKIRIFCRFYNAK